MNTDIQRITAMESDDAGQGFIGSATFGACFDQSTLFRYTLWRRFDDGPGIVPLSDMCAFIGLNPSTADERVNDPTVARCVKFAARWRFRGMVMLNIFAFRATDPKVMRRQLDPVGVLNNIALEHVVRRCGKTVCCWGTHGALLNRGPEVERMLFAMDVFRDGRRKLYHMGLTKDGFPKHPLYLHGATETPSSSPRSWRFDHEKTLSMYALRNVPLLVENRRRCRVTFVSAEPLLGPINPVAWPSIDWLILGGESGPNARPCDVAWILEALTAAAVAGIECFVKQLGENAVNLPIHPSDLD